MKPLAILIIFLIGGILGGSLCWAALGDSVTPTQEWCKAAQVRKAEWVRPQKAPYTHKEGSRNRCRVFLGSWEVLAWDASPEGC